MKKLILSAIIVSLAFTVNAQEIPERKGERPMIHHKQRGHHDRRMALKQLNLTDAQKEQFKTQNEAFRKQMGELKKNENITVKEWKSRMENLRKDHKAKIESIFSAEQKAKLEKMKVEKKAMYEVDAKARLEKMKIHLGLTDDQAAKLSKNRAEMAEKMKAIRENKSLSDEKKREEMKELAKKQKETMKSILTEEQLKKMKEGRKHRPGPAKRYEGPAAADKKTII